MSGAPPSAFPAGTGSACDSSLAVVVAVFSSATLRRRPSSACPQSYTSDSGEREQIPPGPLAGVEYRARLTEGLVAGGVTHDVACRGAHLLAPAGAVARRHGGIPAQAGDHRVGVSAVGVDRDPAAMMRLLPAHEAGRIERTRKEVASMEGVADRARAVVAVVLPAAVAATVDIGLVANPVRGGDHR